MWTASLASGVWLCSAVGAGVFIYRYELGFIWGENWHFDCVFLDRDKYFEECVCVWSVHVCVYNCSTVFVLFGGFSI